MFIGVLSIVVALVCWVIPSPAPYIRRRLAKRDPIAYEHYRKHAMRDGHAPPTPKDCQDGDCTNV